MSTLPPAGSLPIWCASTLSSISIWLEGLGAALLALALVWMVAAARAQRRELEASEGAEQRFLDALQSNPEPVIVVRLADDRILAVNEAFERINGRSRQEVIGRTPHDLRLWPSSGSASSRSFASMERCMI